MVDGHDGEEHVDAPAVVNINPLQLEAMITEITRRLSRQNEQLYANVPPHNVMQVAGAARDEQVGAIGAGDEGDGLARQPIRARRPMHRVDNDPANSDDDDGRYERHNRCNQFEEITGKLKLRVPPFQGKIDPYAYLEWEKKIEYLFKCQNYTEERKVKIIVTEFDNYAINWWEHVCNTRRRHDQNQVSSWHEMKEVMCKRFVPTYYGRELHQKLRRLTQGSKSVAEYHQEMDNLMIKADVVEDEEATMARFQGGINRDIQDRMEMKSLTISKGCFIKLLSLNNNTNEKGSLGINSVSPGTLLIEMREHKTNIKRRRAIPHQSKMISLRDLRQKTGHGTSSAISASDLATMLMNVPTKRQC